MAGRNPTDDELKDFRIRALNCIRPHLYNHENAIFLRSPLWNVLVDGMQILYYLIFRERGEQSFEIALATSDMFMLRLCLSEHHMLLHQQLPVPLEVLEDIAVMIADALGIPIGRAPRQRPPKRRSDGSFKPRDESPLSGEPVAGPSGLQASCSAHHRSTREPQSYLLRREARRRELLGKPALRSLGYNRSASKKIKELLEEELGGAVGHMSCPIGHPNHDSRFCRNRKNSFFPFKNPKYERPKILGPKPVHFVSESPGKIWPSRRELICFLMRLFGLNRDEAIIHFYSNKYTADDYKVRAVMIFKPKEK